MQNQTHTAGGVGPAPWSCLSLTEAVLVPAVGVAPGDRDGDGVEFPRLCSVCKGREDRKRGLGRGLAEWPAKPPPPTLQKRPLWEQCREEASELGGLRQKESWDTCLSATGLPFLSYVGKGSHSL